MELQKNIQKLRENRSPLKIKENIDMHGLDQILNQKDQQIEDIQNKIYKLEEEINKTNNENDFEFDLSRMKQDYKVSRNESIHRTPYTNRQRSVLNKSNITNQTKNYMKSVDKYQQPTLPNQNIYSKNYDQSGTKFVNQMYNDIDKLLNKGRSARNNYVY